MLFGQHYLILTFIVLLLEYYLFFFCYLIILVIKSVASLIVNFADGLLPTVHYLHYLTYCLILLLQKIAQIRGTFTIYVSFYYFLKALYSTFQCRIPLYSTHFKFHLFNLLAYFYISSSDWHLYIFVISFTNIFYLSG